MKSKLMFVLLFIVTIAQAQERRSILDDPNFLSDLGLDTIEEPQRLGTPPCPTCAEVAGSDANIIPFQRERRAGFTFLRAEQIGGVNCLANRFNFSDSPRAEYPGGVNVCMQVGQRIRNLEFRAVDGSREGAFMYFSENISPLDSQNSKTAVLMLPRRSIPNARVVGGEIHLTLSTGELVVLDATTRAHIRGPLSFGPLRTTPGPTPFNYTGSAIVVSGSNNYKMPFEAGGTASLSVRQGNSRCSIPRERLYNAAGNPIAGTDTAMVAALNQHCTPRPARPFTL